ncbi:Oidioi.mRNA.OKI2018_I69.chr2.g6442.t1.cds [Oikopleura dioica]|uniref:Oidioi.mRNA.OKI2018_I69.chr2.g6442.t1.cds n=1 Tax=Oikopleura dioica TaxID=34765 RepID=A0ABN7T6P4_OIKDI|nr:Oidioi.mRNA.OKI2018_I69.chr2.g6442.t1.cds [Oikopleura dioica]
MIAVYGIHFQAIIRLSVGNMKFMLFEMMSAFFEVYLGFLVTILSFSPRGSLQLTSCYTSEKVYLEKWYPFVDAVPGRYELFQSQKSEFNGEGCLYEIRSFQKYLISDWKIYFISCGVLYVSFPYAVLIFSVIALSAYIAAAIQSTPSRKIPKHVPFIYLNMLAMLFGLGGVIYANGFSFWFLFLSTFPAFFFFSTEKMSDLHVLRAEMAYTIAE